MSEQRRQPDNIIVREEDSHTSVSPSILRPATASRLVSEASSMVISWPDEDRASLTEETPEQRHRRRIRFLELRREHYSQMHQHTEQCTMSDNEEEELTNRPCPPETEDQENSE